MLPQRDSVQYSVVVPLYQEQQNIVRLYEGIREVMEPLCRSYECVFVDDGSSDGSAALLREISAVDSRVSVIRLRRNSGKSAALHAGFNIARGEFIITMDGDLQHSPSDIPAFIEKLEEGYDIVCGRRMVREESRLQQALTRFANWTIGKATRVAIHDFGSGFKAYRRDLVAELPIYGELQRLIPAMANFRGARICEIPIQVRARENGASKYGVRNKLLVAFDVITIYFLLRYVTRPLHFFGLAGVLTGLTGCGIALALVVELFRNVNLVQEHGPLMIFSAVLIVAGVQLVALGLLAEMQVRHYYQARGQTAPYVVETVIHAADKPHASSE